jgi:V-type H+-transporting ATPase subunit d
MSAGYLEGVVRGYKGGLLTQAQYNNLTQCENLEGEPCRGIPFRLITADAIGIDFRLQLSATDYGNFLANEPLPLSTATIGDKVRPVPGWGREG